MLVLSRSYYYFSHFMLPSSPHRSTEKQVDTRHQWNTRWVFAGKHDISACKNNMFNGRLAGKMNQIARDYPPCPARKISPKAKLTKVWILAKYQAIMTSHLVNNPYIFIREKIAVAMAVHYKSRFSHRKWSVMVFHCYLYNKRNITRFLGNTTFLIPFCNQQHSKRYFVFPSSHLISLL